MKQEVDIIVPSYNDKRILSTIASIRRFDDSDLVRIIVVDGGSNQELLRQVSENLSNKDILISEPDDGIFDALNKGLAACTSNYIGWLGSDDIFTDEIKSSELVSILSDADIFVAKTVHAIGNKVTRLTPSWPSKFSLVRFGFNNPHFSTFGRRSVFASIQFKRDHPAADILYFLQIFSGSLRIKTDNRPTTIMQEYGASNSSASSIIRTNLLLYSSYRDQTNWLVAAFCVVNKLTWKTIFRLRFSLFPKTLEDIILDQV